MLNPREGDAMRGSLSLFLVLMLVLVGVVAFSGLLIETAEDLAQLLFFFLMIVFLAALFLGRKILE
jgi:uncharacterized membrane protein YtjA (UPF0391 family)